MHERREFSIKRESFMSSKQRALAATAAIFCVAVLGTAQAEEVPEVEEAPEVEQEEAGQEAAEAAVASEEAEADAEEAAEEAIDEIEDEVFADKDDEKDSKDWSVTGSVGIHVGQGTFARVSNDTQWAGEVDDGRGFQSRVSMNFSVTPSYRWKDFTVSSTLSFQQWLTPGGGFNAPYEGRFGDIGINASGGWKGWTIEQLGDLRISPRASVNIPIIRSAMTRTASFRGSVGGGLNVSKNFFSKLTLSYGLSGSRSFHDYTSGVVDIDRIGQENALFRAQGAEAVAPGLLAVGGVNSPWALNNSLSANFRVGDLSATVTYAYSRRWSYNVTEADEFSSEIQCAGVCSGDSMRGAISLGYRINDWLNLSGGVSSGGLPKTADQRSFNFPFWNFNSAVGPSAINIGVSGTY